MASFYITTPIYYVNDIPHIGHAYTSLACDFVARFNRLLGNNVKFLTGTDEHGQKIEKSAEKAGIEAQEFTDKVSANFRHLNEVMNFSNDDFIRTTEKRHQDYVKDIWQKMLNNGDIYLDKYAGWYAVRDEAFYSEDELVDGKAPTGAEVEWVEEPSYFFKLSKYEDKLLEFYQQNSDWVQPKSRLNEVVSFVKSGLRDLSVSRTSFSWGIKVPNDESHVMYVWLDALFNYLSALEGDGSKYWPCNAHIVGKDILRFHAVYWPAFLMSLDIELPKKVFAHGWWTNEGEKISKSLGNVINPLELVEEFGVDYVRYFLIREIPFGNDGNFSKESFVNRVNAELVNNIGNLAQRVLSFIYKHCEATIPAATKSLPQDEELLSYAYSAFARMKDEMDKYALHAAIGVIQDLAHKANEYVDHNAPWALRKTDQERMKSVLYVLAEVIRTIALMLQPIVPESSKKMLDQLEINNRIFDALSASSALVSGAKINKPEGVFPRIVL